MHWLIAKVQNTGRPLQKKHDKLNPELRPALSTIIQQTPRKTLPLSFRQHIKIELNNYFLPIVCQWVAHAGAEIRNHHIKTHTTEGKQSCTNAKLLAVTPTIGVATPSKFVILTVWTIIRFLAGFKITRSS